MIYYNLNAINDWDFGYDNIIKVYRNNAICYYKIDSGSPSGQTPCFAVVEDISQYSDTEFEDVFNKADNKWYKLNNLNQYEEYGIYGSGRTICSATSFIELTDIIAQSTTALTNHNITVTPAVGAFSKIRIDTTNSATTGAYSWTTFTTTPSGSEVLGINMNSIGSMNGLGSGKNYVTDANGSQTFAHWVDDNNTIVEIDIAALSNNQASELYLLFYQENCKPAAFSFYIGSSNCVTTYEGKLTIDDGYEYIYSGGSWLNLGEVSGSTITIKSPEYIEKDSSHNGKINLDYVWKTNSKMQFKFYSTNNGGGSMIGESGAPDNNDCRVFFASTNAYFDYGSGRITWFSSGKTNTLYEYEYGNYYIKNMVTSATRTGTTFSTNRTNPIYLGVGTSDRFRTYYIKIYEGDTLVKNFIPWTDMNGNYGLFDMVSLSVYNVINGTGSLTGSSNVTDVEVSSGVIVYPLEYPVMQDPPNNLSFSSMAEANEYECPWVGMRATINGDKYVFSGDSISGYEWVYQPITCEYKFCGVDANGNDVIISGGTSTLTSSNWSSPYPVEGIVGDATTIIGQYCFTNVSRTLTALTIGNTVTTIEHEAFMETELLTTLTIPASVTQIDFWAFTRCYGLNEVIFEGTTPPTFTNQHDGVFHDYCPPVIYVPDEAVSAYRAIDGSVWTNQSWSTNIIQPISNR